ncbi:AbrB family transcriptional regulator [Primorskyibacter flagellatus]|uniref:AbrB family transcriptional regulator n=1 Tax=Primorskyibacter flagellatus TaxID=1387277 RepID=UPI003A8D026E
MRPRFLLITWIMLLAGAAGGILAASVHLPMPWMLGSLAAIAVIVATTPDRILGDYVFPRRLRETFTGVIGVMIGTQVSPEMIAHLGFLPLSVIALALFVVLAHGGNYLIFRHIGGMEKSTAFFSGSPGGLMESIALGDASGADIRVLSIQQFLRIILVVGLLPLGFSIWRGAPVGSAAGMAPIGHTAEDLPLWAGLALMVLLVFLGQAVGRRIRLPAAQLIGPLVLTGALNVTGLMPLHLPGWVIGVAQVVVGVGLGMRFVGVTGRMLTRSVGLSLLSVSYMMVIGAGFAWALHAATDIPFEHMLLSFAPGGVTEMSLVALSLSANPALVSIHHLIRILLTVLELSLVARRLNLSQRMP